MKCTKIIRTVGLCCVITSLSIESTGSPHQSNVNQNVPITVTVTTPVNFSFSQEINTVMSKVKDVSDKCKEFAAYQWQNISDLYTWMCENKIKTTLYCAAALYFYIHYKLYKLKQSLLSFDNWSLWNYVLPLEEILEKNQKTVAESLMRDIQRRYTNADNPDDFISPIASFLRDVEREQTTLTSYASICSWLKALCIAKICWFDNDLYETTRERLQRLAYFKSILISWVTEYKFAQHAYGAIEPNFNYTVNALPMLPK